MCDGLARSRMGVVSTFSIYTAVPLNKLNFDRQHTHTQACTHMPRLPIREFQCTRPSASHLPGVDGVSSACSPPARLTAMNYESTGGSISYIAAGGKPAVVAWLGGRVLKYYMVGVNKLFTYIESSANTKLWLVLEERFV